MPTRSIIHLSDLHVGRGRKVKRRAAALVRQIPQSFPGVPVLITVVDINKPGRADVSFSHRLVVFR